MKQTLSSLIGLALLAGTLDGGAAPLFEDRFKEDLQEGWRWIREDRDGWKLEEGALQIRVQPGNMWGPANNARNVLVRPLPPIKEEPLAVTARVENHPSEQYEQIDLVWYYDDSHMVKIGEELVDGQLSVVMGREANDRTRTLAIIPLKQNRVDLRLVTQGAQIQGFYRTSEKKKWQKAGECELPAKNKPHISLQAYQGPKDAAHWARIDWIRVEQIPERAPSIKDHAP